MPRLSCAAVAVAVLLAFAATASAATCGTPDPALDRIWERVTGGWQAGDAAYSAGLPGRRAFWIFGDSLIARGPKLHIVRNAAVLKQHDGAMLTVPPTDTADLPFAHLPATSVPDHWLWPGAVTWVDGRLWAFFAEMRRTGSGPWDFRFVDSWLARLDPTTLRIRSLRRAVAGSGVTWGSAVVAGARYLYVFGVHDHGAVKNLHVARVPRSQGLSGTWRYWNLRRWTKRLDPDAHILTDVSLQVSVLRVARGYVLITHDPNLGSAVRAFSARHLVGTWRPANVLYHAAPRTSGGITYNAQAHPELPGPGLALSYSVIENPTGAVPTDPNDYRPRFFRVPWACLGGRPQPNPTAAREASDSSVIPSRPFGESRLAADARGAAVVAWVQTPNPTTPGAAVFLSRRSPGGLFGAPERISQIGQDVRVIGLGVAASGRAALAWRLGEGGPGSRLVLARGTVDSGFGHGRVIARGLPGVGWSGATEHPADPVVDVADDGSTLVAWLAPSACGYVVRALAVSATGRAGRTDTVSRGCPHATTLRGAVDGRGNGAIVWRSGRRCNYGKPCHYAVQAARVRRGRAQPAITVSRHPVAAIGLAVAAGGGRTIVAWRDAGLVTRELTRGRVLGAVSSGGRFSPPVALSATDRVAGFPAAAAGRHGELVVAWQALGNGGGAIEAATAGPGAAFAAPGSTGGTTNGFGYRTAPLAAFDLAGNATIAWTSADGALRAAARSPGGEWRLTALSPGPGHAPALAGGAAGEAIALWTAVTELGQLESLHWAVVR
jgi:hypothetical protein